MTDPTTWGGFEQAKSMALSGHCAGIGFVFTKHDPYAFIDLDDPVDSTDSSNLRTKIIGEFDSYTELSPSGKGYHIIIKADTIHGRRRDGIELYSGERYATMTGNVTHNVAIAERQELAEVLFRELGGEKAATAGAQPDRAASADDAAIVSALCVNPSLAALWGGDKRAYGDDHSRADQALCNALAARSGNRAQVERLWLASPLGQRDKTQRREDYRCRTIEAAFDRPAPIPVDLSAVTVNGAPLLSGFARNHTPATSSTPWFSAASLQSKRFDPVEWVVPGVIPQGAVILGGRPKLGKSWLALDVAIAVAEGGTVLGKECSVGAVLYAALEDTERRLQSRMWKLKGKSSWPAQLELLCELPRADEGGLDVVRRWINGVDNPRLVIVDTLALVRTSKKRDEQSYDADYRAVTPWKQLADKYGIAIILVHHVRKQAADDPLEMISGTNGLTGAADAVIILDRKQGCILAGRGRDLEEFEIALQFDSNTCRWNNLGDAAAAQRSGVRQVIILALASTGKPLGPSEIAHIVGNTDASVRQLLAKMVEAGEVIKVDRGLYTVPVQSP